MINLFRGKHMYLSNMYECKLSYKGLTYLCSESAFQAQKCANEIDKQQFTKVNGYEAKRLGRSVKLIDNWDNIKLDVMYEIVLAKFKQNPELLNQLLSTGDEELVEGNYWNDKYWGVCNGIGQNNLGKILMRVRTELRQEV